jgi:glycosyltransferase involved in cell wall biosynthesis
MAKPHVRLLQAIAGGAHGGAEMFFVRLAAAFARAGVEQRLVVRRDQPWAKTLRAAKIPLRPVAFGGALDVVSGRTFAQEVTAFDPDVVLTWMNRATRFCPRRKAGTRPLHIARLGGYYDLKYYQRCDHLIGNTQDIVRYLVAEGWPAARAHYVPNFVDATPAAALPRATFETPDDAPLIVALGRLHQNKAFDVLLKALARLPTTYLWLAGEGPLRQELEGLAARLDVRWRVRFLGWRDDVPSLLASADILACPSRAEPLGNVVIEGWAHRRPVIAAASEGPRALVSSGETGLLVPLEDAEAFAMSVQTIIDNPALGTRLAAAGRAAYEASFTEDAVVAQYLDLFDRLSGQCAA